VSLPASAEVDWPVSHRIIRTVYPPVSLFEDIADPADWDLIASLEAKSNPRVRDQIGELTLVPPARRLAGPTASLVMGAFTHASRARPSRFTDGSFGIWYCGDVPEVAIAETVFHHENFMRQTAEPAGMSDFRELVCGVGGQLVDLRGGAAAECLAPDDYGPGQALGRAVHEVDGDGIVYPSVRWAGGQAAALFWPNRIRLPVLQARQLRYYWDGTRVTRYFVHGTRSWIGWP
jgi:hypothetical protein